MKKLTQWLINVPKPDVPPRLADVPARGEQAVLPLGDPESAAAQPPAAKEVPAAGQGAVEKKPLRLVETKPRPTPEEREAARIARLMALHKEAQEIAQFDAWKTGDVGYISSHMVQLTLPHREPPKDLPVWGRRTQHRQLVIQPGYILGAPASGSSVPRPVPVGYPYGSIPRLLLAWVGKEAVRTRQRELILGSSLANFMRELGFEYSNGGPRGSITRLREQMRRLFWARIAVVDKAESMNWSLDGFQLADKMQVWWDQPHQQADQSTLFDSRVQLSERFFEELVKHPVPLDMRVLKLLRASTFGLDIYCWLTYRASSVTQPTDIPWEALQMQFGSEAAELWKFRQLFRRALLQVAEVYPDARFEDRSEAFRLLPMKTSVPRRIGPKVVKGG